MTLAPAPPPPRRFVTGRQWMDALGDVPLDRVIFDPPPGHATVEDQFELEKQGRVVELVDNTLVEKAVGFWKNALDQSCSLAWRSTPMTTTWASSTAPPP